jgi:O-methyltransferase
MSTKDAVNSLVARVSGYYLTKSKPGETDAEIRRQRAKIVSQRAKIQNLNDEIAGAKASAEPQSRAAARPKGFDENADEIIRVVRGYTMSGVDELSVLISAARYVARHNIPGDIVECGVWRGGTMQAIARALVECGDTSRNLYLFDTFEGMPAAQDKDSTVAAIATLDDVQTGFATVPYPAEKVHLVKGKVEDTVPAKVPETISILRLDADWYESTAYELQHMWERLSSGGVLVLDDYGRSKAARQATDEFLERTGARLLFVRTNSARVAVKP